jgi:AcrR family transcriptional regulator
VAANLFEQNGFAATTMDDIAERAGISRKSLFVYFPSKADLIWHRSGPYVENLRKDLARQGEPLTSIVLAIRSGFNKVDRAESTLRSQARLHATDEDARALVETRGLAWRQAIEGRLTEDGADLLVAEMIGYGFWRAMWTALELWASEEAESLDSVMARAMGRMTAAAGRLLNGPPTF